MISPSLKGIPVARENPIAAGVPESGIGRTRSASAGASRGELLAHPDTRAVHLDALEPGVGAREIEELEDAERAGRAVDGLGRLDSRLVHDQELAGATSRSKSAPIRSRAQVSEATTQPSVESAEYERPEAVRVAEGEQLALRERGHGVRALEPAHGADDRVAERRVSFAISAAISSVSEVDESFTSSSSRSSDALTRLPLWPTATVRAARVGRPAARSST